MLPQLFVLALAGLSWAQTQFTATSVADVAKAASTAQTESPVSDKSGKAFNRVLTIYLETTAFNNTVADRKTIISVALVGRAC